MQLWLTRLCGNTENAGFWPPGLFIPFQPDSVRKSTKHQTQWNVSTATVVDKFTSSVWIIKQGVLVKIIFLVTKLQHNTVCPVSEQYCNIASPSLDLHQEFISPSGIASTVSLWSPSVKCRTITFTLCLNLCWFAAAANHTNIWFGSNSIRWQLCVYLLYRWNCMENKQTPSSYTGLPD